MQKTILSAFVCALLFSSFNSPSTNQKRQFTNSKKMVCGPYFVIENNSTNATIRYVRFTGSAGSYYFVLDLQPGQSYSTGQYASGAYQVVIATNESFGSLTLSNSGLFTCNNYDPDANQETYTMNFPFTDCLNNYVTIEDGSCL